VRQQSKLHIYEDMNGTGNCYDPTIDRNMALSLFVQVIYYWALPR